MTELSPNIFTALFTFHPRNGHSPQENFLTEAFVYVIRNCEKARDSWLRHAIGEPVSTVTELRTRATERDSDDHRLIPDMTVSGVLSGGEHFVLYSEHKWNSPCDPRQLKKYLERAEAIAKKGLQARVIFIGASNTQADGARSCDPRMRTNAFLWADVFEVLDRIRDKPPILLEFLEFMNEKGLSPGHPITTEAMMGYIHADGFLLTLLQFTNTLNREFDWSFVPQRYRRNDEADVSDRYGRVAIEFATPDWRPSLTVGFLYNPTKDHKVRFVDRERGIDLFLRIETDPKNQRHIQSVLRELGKSRDELLQYADSVLLHGDAGNGNRHTILIVRSCLGQVLQNQNKRKDQLQAIHSKLQKWCEILFKNEALENVLKSSGLDSGI